jgi:hypothetical protein
MAEPVDRRFRFAERPPTATSGGAAGLRFGLAVVAIALFGCGPLGPIPGNWLRGELVTEPVQDWSFTDDYFEIQVETRGNWLPHSVTTICMAVGPHLYVPARRGGVKTWVANLIKDPRARIRIGGQVYERTAVRVMEGEELGPAALALLRKYYGVEADAATFLTETPAEDDDRVDLWVFRMDPRDERAESAASSSGAAAGSFSDAARASPSAAAGGAS